MKEKQKLEYIDNEEKEIVESLKDIDVNSIANDAEHIKQLEKSAKDYNGTSARFSLKSSKSSIQ